MRGRALLVLVASTALAVLLLRRQSLQDLESRLRFLKLSASRDVATRRLNGSSAAFDRPYFFFLELARRKLPPDTTGVAVFPERSVTGSGAYLTIYHLAPLPALVDPPSVPRGWMAIVAGPRRPFGWQVLAEVPGGAVLRPPP